MKDKQLQANRNTDAMRLAWSSIRDRIEKAALGGGRQRIEKEHAKGKLTARERLDRLFDPGSQPIEIGALAGEGMYEKRGAAREVASSCRWATSKADWSLPLPMMPR